MKKILLIFMFAAMSAVAMGADVVTVTGEATYYDDGTRSKVECMRLAAEQARVDALARKFGTIVSQDIVQNDRITGGRERNDFLSLSSTEVKGEWIADDGEPEYEFSHDADQNLIVTCRVRGKAKEISNESVAFEALVLRNGTGKQNADNRFRNGDDLFLYFNGAADGFVSVFLEDENGVVSLLLPYPSDTKSRVPVRKDREYVFFSPQHKGGQSGPIDEFVITGGPNVEYNRMYVVYSPEPFSAPALSRKDGIPVMGNMEFNKWLAKARRNDPRMGVKAVNMTIEP